jgi:hypothetical protein
MDLGLVIVLDVFFSFEGLPFFVWIGDYCCELQPFSHFQLIFQVGTISVAGEIGQGLQHKVPQMILNPNRYQLASHDLVVKLK